jgi:GH25 family lysozyme M1 (1,4-beta-N-acetylmuramidase)
VSFLQFTQAYEGNRLPMNFDFHGIFGFDVSTWQDASTIPGNIDFAKMRDYGASFVVIKASQGDFADVDFVTNWKNAKGVLPRSSYHYYDNRYDPKVQARKYTDVLRTDSEGIYWLDLEDRSAATFAGWRKWYDFLEEMKILTPGIKLGIYTNFYYWVEYLRFATDLQLDYFKQYPLWLASYPEDPFHPDYRNILCPPPWDSPLILQSGTPAIGLDAGVESKDIDYNQFNGTREQFAARYIVGEIFPPEDGETMKIGTLNQALNYRNGFGTIGTTILGTLKAGDKVIGTIDPVKQWFVIDSLVINGVQGKPDVQAYCSAWTGYYSTIAEYVPPTPPAGLPDVLWIGETQATVKEYRKAV